MTFREVFISYSAICRRRKEEIKFQARIMGAEIKEDEQFINGNEVSEDQTKLIEKLAEESLNKRGMKKWRT